MANEISDVRGLSDADYAAARAQAISGKRPAVAPAQAAPEPRVQPSAAPTAKHARDMTPEEFSAERKRLRGLR